MPESPDVAVPGSLDFSPEQGARLNLLGSLQADLTKLNQAFDPPLVHGVDEGGTQVTLLGCQQINAKLGFGGGGAQVTAELVARFTLTGILLLPDDLAIFDRAFVRFSCLDEWACLQGFEIEFDDTGSAMTLKYQRAQPRPILASPDLAVSLHVEWSGPSMSMVQKSAELSQRAVLQFDFQTPQGIEYILKSANALAHFLSLGVGGPVYPVEVNLQSPEIEMELGEGKRHRVSVPLLYRIDALKEPPKSLLPVEMNFNLVSSGDRIQAVATRWLELAPILEPVSNLFFGAMFAPHMYLQFRFLSLAYALESFHRRCRQQEIDPEHDERLRAILEASPEQFRKWLADKLRYSHEPTFRRRTKALLDEFGPLGDVLASPRDRFVDAVVTARNNLTHYEGDEGILDDVEALYRLTQRLQGLVAVCLLVETGFTHEEVMTMVQGYSRFFQGILFSIGEETTT